MVAELPIRSPSTENAPEFDPCDELFIRLSERDGEIVLKAIETETEPNQALRDLVQRWGSSSC